MVQHLVLNPHEPRASLDRYSTPFGGAGEYVRGTQHALEYLQT